MPNVLNVASPPTVRIRVGEPLTLEGESLDEDTERIMEAITDLLPDEAHVEHEPTAEELALTYPPGYSGDPAAEAERRPGSD
jgi:putative phosphoserine phosphatase/1-acylglycerol-3-phosphate O-acyltransferase